MTPKAQNTEQNSDEITVLGGRVKLRQAEKGFRTCMDGVMLAAACPVKDGQTVLDMGAGVGSVSLCIHQRVKTAQISGVELQDVYYDLAVENAALNDAADQVNFIKADIRTFNAENRFNHVVCNPPYMEHGAHLISPTEEKARALGHIDEETGLEDWINCAFRNLKSGGSFSIIHRADMLDRIIRSMGLRFGAIEILPLLTKAGKPCKRVIIRAIKDRRSPCTLYSGFVIRGENDAETPEAVQVLRDAKALPFA